MADYSKYATPTGEWIRHEENFPTPPSATTTNIPLEELQRTANEGRAKASLEAVVKEGLDSKIAIKTYHFPTRDGFTNEVRSYISNSVAACTDLAPVYIYIHGGGFLSGSLDSDHVECARVAADRDVVVISMNYRHTPQYVYPTQHLDIFDAFDWVLANLSLFHGDPRKVILGGVSAGSNQAAAIAVREASRPPPRRLLGLILMTPWVIHPAAFPWEMMAAKEKCSFVQNANAPVLPFAAAEKYAKILQVPDVKKNYLNSLDRPDEVLKAFPPTALMVAGGDPLRDEGLLFAERLKKNGVPTRVHVFQGMPHAFRRFGDLKAASRWDDLIGEFIRGFLDGKIGQSGVTGIGVEAYD